MASMTVKLSTMAKKTRREGILVSEVLYPMSNPVLCPENEMAAHRKWWKDST
jgi:ABC-type transport system involved in cytochrome c biogenesis permease component